MKNRIELWISTAGNVAFYRGSAYIPKEELTEEERQFVLDKVLKELTGDNGASDKSLDDEIQKYTEELYNETFGTGQGTLNDFDWDDIDMVIEDAAHHFYELGKNSK